MRLTEAAGCGDRNALELLLERYLPQLRAFVRLRAGAIVRARESSSDLVQSVCREVLEHMDRLKHPSETAFKSWLYTTALRKIINRRDFYLAQKRDALREIPMQHAGGTASASNASDRGLLDCYGTFTTPSRGAILKEEVERIEGAFEQLSEEHREVITMAHIVGMSRKEIAEAMGKTEGAVRVLLHRALVKVSGLLSPNISDE
ncbi:MAG: RNA polymerase sigma-70 factor (subfamily 1) [Planctomycetota bacterium]|jgi:RNA polymerase sigma-70 factor (subfamily 1)